MSEGEKRYTCVATCGECGAELNRAEHVPERERTRVIVAAPMVALCDVRGHNTLSDLNLRVVLTWVEETPPTDGSPDGSPERAQPGGSLVSIDVS